MTCQIIHVPITYLVFINTPSGMVYKVTNALQNNSACKPYDHITIHTVASIKQISVFKIIISKIVTLARL